ncbi:MAG TPA: ABC transporter substrate-binding protein [Elusimicrobiota bacterium]|jgi:peptide/nickel transport system substrate-binding protein|nr:ABC transporter substrate-binding protein [Elusimicrobiota bacterium]
MKKSLAAALSLALAAAPLAVPAAAAVKNPDTFVYATIGDPESFDPAWAYDSASQAVIANVYEYLLAFKGSGTRTKDLMPLLATKVPSQANGLISADGKTYRFPIRKGVRFHDGALMTPDDARYSLLRFMLFDRDGGPSSLLLEPILGLTSTRRDGKLVPGLWEAASKAVTVEGDVLTIHLKRPFAPFLTILVGFGAIGERKWCAAHGQWDGEGATVAKFNNPGLEGALPKELMNGTGPFQLERFERNTKQVILTRNDRYWRKPAALKTVVIKVVDEFETRKLMVEAGDADVVYVPLMYYPQVQGIPGVEVIDGLQNLERSLLVTFTFKMNPVANGNIGSGKLDGNGVPPDFFSDKDVRKAFAYSIDYPGYIRDILRGRGTQSAGLIPPGLIGYKAGPPRYTFDLKKAAEHFKKAWGGQVWDKGFKVAIVFNTGSAPAQALSQMIKRNVESLNPKFEVDVRQVEWSTYLHETQARIIPIQLGAWQADYPDPHNFVFPLLDSAGYYPTKQGYSNPKLDALIEEAAHTLNESRRAELYKKIQDIADDDVPCVPVADGPRYRVQRTWVKGFVFRPAFPDMPYNSYYYDLHKAE